MRFNFLVHFSFLGIFGASHGGANLRGTGDIYEGLGPEGSPIVMNLEMNKIVQIEGGNKPTVKKKSKTAGNVKKGKGA